MGDWAPEKKLDSNGRTVYFWTIPARGKGKKEQGNRGSPVTPS